MIRLARTIFLFCLLLVSAPSTGSAQTPQAPDADALFAHGVLLMKADNCTDAIPEFLKSNELDSSAATLLNLGTCYARLGRKATAWKTYQKAAVAAQTESADALRERALQAMALLGPTLTKVQIVASKESPPLALRLNGETLSDYDGLPIPLDPGENVIEAAAPGREPWRRTIKTGDLGATLVIQVPDLPPMVQQHAVGLAAPLPEKETTRPADLRLPGAILGGVGVAALAVGTAFGISAQNGYEASNANCEGNRCTQTGIDQRDTAHEKATVSTIAFSVGAVVLATGIVLWILSPSRHTSATKIVAPSVAWEGWEWQMAIPVRR
jgi:hypothetical protein